MVDELTLEEAEADVASIELSSPIQKTSSGRPVENELTLDEAESVGVVQVSNELGDILSLALPQEVLDGFKKQPVISFWERMWRDRSSLLGDMNFLVNLTRPGIGQVRAIQDVFSAVTGGEERSASGFTKSPVLHFARMKFTLDRIKANEYGEEDDELHARDIQTVLAFWMKSEEERIRGFDTGGEIAGGVLMLPELMLSFLATGGLASLAKGATKAGVKKLIGEAVVRSLKKATESGAKKLLKETAFRVGGGLVGGAVRTPLFQQMIVRGALERSVASNLELTPEGIRIIEGAGEAPVTSYLKSLASVFVDTSIEGMGGIVSPLVGKGIKRVGSKFMPKGLITTLRKLYDRLHPKGNTVDFFRRMGQQTFFGELEEEQWSKTVQLALNIEKFDDPKDTTTVFGRITGSLFGAQELLVTAGVLAFPAGARFSIGQTVSIIEKRKKKTGFKEPRESRVLTDAEIDGVLALSEKTKGLVAVEKEVLPLQTEQEILDILAEKIPPPEGVSLEAFRNAVRDRAARAKAKAEVKEPEVEKKPPPPKAPRIEEIDVAARQEREAAEERQKSLAAERESLTLKFQKLKERRTAEQKKGRVTTVIDKQLADTEAQIDAIIAQQEDVKVSIEEGLVLKGRIERLSEEGEALQTEVDKIETQQEKIIAKQDKATDKLDDKLDDTFNRIQKLEKKRARAKAKFKPTQGIDNEIIRLKKEVETLDKQNAKLIETAEKEVAALEKKKDQALRKFDELSETIIELEKGLAPPIKARRKITLTAQQAISALTKKFKQGVAVTKTEIREAQKRLTAVIKASGLEQKDKAKFLDTVRGIQSLEQLSAAFPKIDERIQNLRTKSQRRKLLIKIDKLMKRTQPKRRRGLPRGRFTAEAQRKLDFYNQAMKMTELEAENHIEDMHTALAKQTIQRTLDDGTTVETQKLPTDDPLFILEKNIFEKSNDIKERTVKELENILRDIEFVVEQGRTQREIVLERKRKEVRDGIVAIFRSVHGDTPAANISEVKFLVEEGEITLKKAKALLSDSVEKSDLSQNKKQELLDQIEVTEFEVAEEVEEAAEVDEEVDAEIEGDLKELLTPLVSAVENAIPVAKPGIERQRSIMRDLVKSLQDFGISNENWNGILFALSKGVTADPKAKDVSEITTPIFEIATMFEEVQAEKSATAQARAQMEQTEMDTYGFTSRIQLIQERISADRFISVEIVDATGKVFKLNVTRNEIMNLWQVMQNADTLEQLESNKGGIRLGGELIQGVTPEAQVILLSHLNPKDLAFAQEHIDFGDKENYPKFAAKFEDRQGVPLPKLESHTHIKRFQKVKKLVDSILEDIGQRLNITPSSGRNRTKNFMPIIIRSARQVMDESIVEVNHFVHMADKVDLLQSIFGRGEIRQLLSEQFGDALLKHINSHIISFQTGRRKDPEAFESKLRVWRGRMVVAQIGIKPAIAIKQLISMFTALEIVGLKTFVKNLGNFIRHPKIAIGIMEKSREMEFRGIRSQSRDLEAWAQSPHRAGIIKSDKLAAWMNLMGEWMTKNVQLGDRFGIFLGGWSIYNHNIDKGLTPDQALLEMDKWIVGTQQSSDIDQLSVRQKGGPLWEMATTYMNAPAQYYRRITNAWRNRLTGRITTQQFAKTIFIYQVFLPTMFAWLSDLFIWDDDKEEQNKLLRGMILSPLDGIPMARDVAKFLGPKATNAITGAKEREFTLAQSIKILEIFKGVGDAFDELDFTDLTLEDTGDALEDFMKGFVGPALGLPIKTALDSWEGVRNIYDGEVTKGTLEVLGWTPFTVEKRLGKKKKKRAFD